MRDLIACLHIWLTPGLRRTLHTAYRHARNWISPPPPPAPKPVLPPCPAYARRPLADHVRARSEPLAGEETSLARPYIANTEQITADVRAARDMFGDAPSPAAVAEISTRLRAHLVALLSPAQATLRSLSEGAGGHRLATAIDYALWQLNARARNDGEAQCHMFRLTLAVEGLLPEDERLITRNETPPARTHLLPSTTRRMSAAPSLSLRPLSREMAMTRHG